MSNVLNVEKCVYFSKYLGSGKCPSCKKSRIDGKIMHWSEVDEVRAK